MNFKESIQTPDDSLEELEMDSLASVDDFLRELEAKEKDLHITSDLTIEVSDSEYDPRNAPAFLPDDIGAPPPQPRRPMPGRAPMPQDPEAQPPQQPGLKTRVYELERELASLEKRMSAMRAERNEIQEKSDRRLKDFENYKYRMDRERRGAFIDQISNLAKQMLPVLDNLDRAMGSLDKGTVTKSPEFQQFYDGIALVHNQVHEIFAEMGVQPITTVGETFDPNFHEAVATEERDDVPGNTVSEEMLKGYRIGNRVIRHSMVKVTIGPPPPKPPPVAEENELFDLDPEDNGVAE
jgi:molecular chaperone GrpE